MSYKYETKYNSPNFTKGSDALKVFGYKRKIDGFCLHHWGDPKAKPSYEGVRSYLSRKNGNTSAHMVVTGTGRRVSVIVNYNDVAWHSGNAWGNARTIGIELDPRGRESDKDVFAEVLADLRSAFGDKPLYMHSHFSNTQCPGVYKKLLSDLDKRSYQKISGNKFGQVTNKKTPAPVIPPKPKAVPKKVSPTTKKVDGTPQPDTGVAVVHKIDYKEENNVKEKIMQVAKPSKVSKDQWVQVLKAGLYVGVSAVLAFFISVVTENPDLFGTLTPVVNVVLVTVKKVFSEV